MSTFGTAVRCFDGCATGSFRGRRHPDRATEDGNLRAHGPLTDGLRDAIRANKAQLLAELAANEPVVDPTMERRRVRALAILAEEPHRQVAVVAEAGDPAHVASTGNLGRSDAML